MTVDHTPGPWVAELLNKRQSNEHWRVGNAEAGNDIVAELMDYVSYPEERDKNAALVSAAPDLLATCEASGSALVIPKAEIFICLHI